MTCYNPLRAWKTPYKTKEGKTKYRITPSTTQPSKDYPTYKEVPCGKCIGCKLDYANAWANRCMIEAQYHEPNFFLTLTYDNEHLPKNHSISKREFQLFMKRLRKEYGENIKVFASGEYGSITFRPHYHAIIYGIKIDDLLETKLDEGETTWISEKIEKIWGNGNVLIGSVTMASCAYVARYNMKKIGKNDKKEYVKNGLEPPFLLMSKGIGKQYALEHPEIFQMDEVIIATEEGGKKFKIPKYFERLYKDRIINLEEKHLIRANNAEIKQKARQERTGMTKEQLQEQDMFQKERKAQSLRRKYE